MEELCSQGVFTEQDDQVAAPRALLTKRAVWWAARQMRRKNASVTGLARQLDTAWATVHDPVMRLLEELDADQSRFDGVEILGVGEHLWRHENPLKRGPIEFTGMVDLTPDKDGHARARLLDLVAGRSGPVYACWLD